MTTLTSALRQLCPFIGLTIFTVLAHAQVDGLPADLQNQQSQIEQAHLAGLNLFFEKLDQDCDSLNVLQAEYKNVKTQPISAKLFRIESTVVASCERRETWFCYSSFTADGTYRFTDCETDAPAVDQ